MEESQSSPQTPLQKIRSGLQWFAEVAKTSFFGQRDFKEFYRLSDQRGDGYAIYSKSKLRERSYGERICSTLFSIHQSEVSDFLQEHFMSFTGSKTQFLDYSKDLFYRKLVSESNSSENKRTVEDHLGRLNTALSWIEQRYQDMRHHSHVSEVEQLRDIIIKQNGEINQLKTELAELQKDQLVFHPELSEQEIIDIFFQLSVEPFGKATETVLMSKQREICRILPRLVENITIQPESIRNYFKDEGKRIGDGNRRIRISTNK